MGKKKAKYYVVWEGKNPGIYNNWTDCQLQVSGWQGARFKSFDTLKESEDALQKGSRSHNQETLYKRTKSFDISS